MGVDRSVPGINRAIAAVAAGSGDQELIAVVEEAAEVWGERGDRAKEALKKAGRR